MVCEQVSAAGLCVSLLHTPIHIKVDITLLPAGSNQLLPEGEVQSKILLTSMVCEQVSAAGLYVSLLHSVIHIEAIYHVATSRQQVLPEGEVHSGFC